MGLTPETKTPPKGGRITESLGFGGVLARAIAILILLALACQPLTAQNPLTLDEIREGILRLRECRLDRARVADLETETERLRSISAMLEEAYKMRLESEQRARELDRREAAIGIAELRGQLAAWQARSRDQASLIEELSKRRKWWCLWMCSRGIKTREIPEPTLAEHRRLDGTTQ